MLSRRSNLTFHGPMSLMAVSELKELISTPPKSTTPALFPIPQERWAPPAKEDHGGEASSAWPCSSPPPQHSSSPPPPRPPHHHHQPPQNASPHDSASPNHNPPPCQPATPSPWLHARPCLSLATARRSPRRFMTTSRRALTFHSPPLARKPRRRTSVSC